VIDKELGAKFLEWGNRLNMGQHLAKGDYALSTVRHVDRQGRIALPSEWRSKSLKGGREVVVMEHEDFLLIRPRRKIDLTEFFNSVKVDIDPKAFADYNLLKQALLKKTQEK